MHIPARYAYMYAWCTQPLKREYILDETGKYALFSWATFKSVVHLCSFSTLIHIFIYEYATALWNDFICVPFILYIYIYAIADDVMIQHFMLHLQRPIIFNINILYAPRRFLSLGSIYRQLKCKTLPIDFIFFSLYWLLLFIHSKKAIRLVLKRIEFEVQRNSFDRYWKEKTLNKHSNESTEILLLTYKRNSISLYISISSYQ